MTISSILLALWRPLRGYPFWSRPQSRFLGVRRETVAALVGLSLVAASCESLSSARSGTSANSGAMSATGQSSAYRDLRQHTDSADKSEECFGVDVSPDGSQMAFVVRRYDGRVFVDDIYLKGLNTKSRIQKTADPTSDLHPAISPDGTKLAYASMSGGSYDIFVTNIGSSRARRQITSSSAEEISPTWSRDGKRIAFSRFSVAGWEWEICVFDLDTGATTTLVPGLFPSYSPVEDLLVFQRVDRQSRRFSLWTVDESATIETEVLRSPDGDYVQPRWSPDGRFIVFTSSGKRIPWIGPDSSRRSAGQAIKQIIELRGADVWTMQSNGTGLTQLTSQDTDESGAVWGRDGRIYFVSNRDGNTNIWSALPEFVALTEPVSESPTGQ